MAKHWVKNHKRKGKPVKGHYRQGKPKAGCQFWLLGMIAAAAVAARPRKGRD